MFKFKKILVSVVILAVFLGTMSIFASAASAVAIDFDHLSPSIPFRYASPYFSQV